VDCGLRIADLGLRIDIPKSEMRNPKSPKQEGEAISRFPFELPMQLIDPLITETG
jgi:hypothetical protein